MLPPHSFDQTIDRIVREEWGRILASLVKSLGDFQLAEDCLQEAIVAALDHWKKNGLPQSPAGWLISVARRRAIDRLRRDQNFASKKREISYLLDLENSRQKDGLEETIPDKRLEMIFTCCHPALEEKTQIALTLRTLGGLTTVEIANAFLDKPDAMQQRLTRAKKKIAAAGIPYRIPELADLQPRLFSVLRVIYLIFNEGYSATSGQSLTRSNLSNEAIRLARIILDLLPNEGEVAGLLALMLLHDARRVTRTDADGTFIPLERQNRARWNHAQIAEGSQILKSTLGRHPIGPYQIQAAISAVHAQSPSWQDTDWDEIVALYDLLFRLEPTPVVRINQAVALSFARSPDAALEMLRSTSEFRDMQSYQPYHVACADIYTRLGQVPQARAAYLAAIALTDNEQEAAHLKKRMDALTKPPTYG